MLLAERDRGYIKQLKLNRDAEEDLMKDVEGWEVGTWFGEPIYKTVRDEL
jgi:NADH dehydrogenase (ubiquinone) 1 alpha subcomplex subunit 13